MDIEEAFKIVESIKKRKSAPTYSHISDSLYFKERPVVPGITDKVEENGQAIKIQVRADGSCLRYYQCNLCKDYKVSSDCAFDVNGHACCLTCREGFVPGVRSIKLEIPPAYAFADLSQVAATNRKTFEQWPKDSPFICVVGGIGAGKTFIVWSVAKHLAQKGIRATVLDCKDARHEYVGSLNEHRGSLLKRWSSTPYLLLDSVADVPATEGWKQAMFTLLDRRWNAQLPTIITTNADGPEFEQMYGTDLRSRLNQYRIVNLGKEDRRRAKAA